MENFTEDKYADATEADLDAIAEMMAEDSWMEG